MRFRSARRTAVTVVSVPALLLGVTVPVAAGQTSATPTSSAASASATATAGSSSSSTSSSGSSTAASSSSGVAGATSSGADSQACPKLMVYAMQGTGQSAPDASEKTHTGALGEVLGPVMDKVDDEVMDYRYVPYEASFGGAPGTGAGKTEYSRSVTGGADKLTEMIAEDAERCSDMLVGIIGYSQGAGGADKVAEAIGNGDGPVEADKLAMGSMLSSPGRAPGAPVFPGAEGQEHPDAAPGVEGTSVEEVAVTAEGSEPAPGGGLGPEADVVTDYGDATGRVASWCEAGDLACDVPEGAPIARVIANLGGQSELNPDDPVGSLYSVADALATTTIKTGTEMVNEDISGESLTDLSYEPERTISQRMETASDPRTPAGDAGAALQKLGTIGLNSVVAVAKEVITPANIAELATVGFAAPEAALGMFVGKLGEAVVRLGAPTGTRLATQVMDTVEQEVEVNKELPAMVTDVNYWQAAQRHGSYFETPATPTGKSAADVTTAWLTALAVDLGADLDSGEASQSSGSSTVATSSAAEAAGSSSVMTVEPNPVSSSAVVTVTPTPTAEPATAGQ